MKSQKKSRLLGFSFLIVSAYIFLSAFVQTSVWALEAGDQLRALPVQDSGRLKPFDSFSREVLEIVYGKSTLEGKQAYEITLTWLLSPQAWQGKELFEVRNHEVLKALKLDENKRYFRGDELFANDRFSMLRQELQEKRDSKDKLTPYFQALQRLENQFFLFSEMASGKLLKIFPPKEGKNWLAVAELTGAPQEAFLEMSKKFVDHISAQAQGKDSSEIQKAAQALDESVLKFRQLGETENPSLYPATGRMNLEVHYNTFHPFRWAYSVYILAACFVLFLWITAKPKLMMWAWILTLIGFGLHSYGFALRVYLAERPPVSNMYETVVWVAWGSLVFSMILESIYKFKFILLAGLLVGVFGMVVADSAPAILDPSIQPLEPVLRSSYWLTVHVMTITISYAAFFLAFMLGDIALVYYIKGESENREKLKAIVLSIYRAMQIGVTFLAPGIILGGIWADYSWGRFWGWDPKETWALIVLLGYIAVLHGRLVGWIRDFGMVVTSILSFNLVIMAWYGVNFVLGAGLHSYGFGAGGVEYVSVFILLHLFFVIYAFWVRRDKKATA